MTRILRALAALTLFAATTAHAEAPQERVQASGYYRVMTRPDFQGGNGKLGYWNLHGRLLNEGPYGMLNLRLHVLPRDPTTNDVYASVVARIEGGSIAGVDTGGGSLSNFRVSQLYLEAGNILLDGVTWRLGTLEFFSGDLGLYDMRPAALFGDAVGLSALHRGSAFDLIVGVGDAGYFIRGLNYSTIFTGGAWIQRRFGTHFEVGVGAQGYFEPQVDGNRNAPYATPGLKYEDWVRKEVVKNYLLANPGQENLFPKPDPRSSKSGRVVAYVGFGNFGPLLWNNLFANATLRQPDVATTESVNGRDYTLYIRDLTDQRTSILIGNEMQLRILPGRFDVVWALLYGRDRNGDNALFAGEDNRDYMSTVIRGQVYMTERIHLLIETSIARETTVLGNSYREHVDSVFRNNKGVADDRGYEYGDSPTRTTWQGKGGVVFSPLGRGVYTRPSLRLLYGIQYSNQANAFGTNFVTTLDQFNQFPNVERHWHSVIALEGEGWF